MRALLPSILLGCLALTGATTLTSAEALPDPREQGLMPGERLEALVDRARLEHERVETMEADFVQLKESAMLLEPAEAAGTFSFAAPDRARWEFEAPDPISLLIEGEQTTTWYRDLSKAEVVQIGRHSQRVLEFLGAGNSLGTLLDYFDAALHIPADTSLPYQLDLTPLYERIAKKLDSLTLWIDPELFLPIRLRYVEADGDVTEYRFHDMRVNDGIPDSRFELDLPASVDVRSVDLGQAGSR